MSRAREIKSRIIKNSKTEEQVSRGVGGRRKKSQGQVKVRSTKCREQGKSLNVQEGLQGER